MGRTAKDSFNKGLVAEPSKKGDAPLLGSHGMTKARAPSKKAPAAEAGPSKKLGRSEGKR